MPEFITERAALDFLTVTTYYQDIFNSIFMAITTQEERTEADDFHIPRYAGRQFIFDDGTLFFGEGEQQGARHFLISATGGTADKFGLYLSGIDDTHLTITRIDVQVTIDKPQWFRARDAVDSFEALEWPGRRSKPELYESGGNDTCYLGSKHSDRRIRIYVKETDFLRFELQLRKEYAMSAWARYKRQPHLSPAGILVGQLMRLPKFPLTDLYKEHLKKANSIEVQKAKPVKTASKSWRWFRRQISPALVRMLNDHDIGGRVRAHLEEILRETKPNGDTK